MPTSSTYNYNISINGASFNGINVNGTAVTRCIVNGTDVINKITTKVQNISVQFSISFNAQYDESGGCHPTHDLTLYNTKFHITVNRGDSVLGLYVTKISYSGYYTIGGHSSQRENIEWGYGNSNFTEEEDLNSPSGWISNYPAQISFEQHFTLKVYLSNGEVYDVTGLNANINTGGSVLSAELGTFSKSFTQIVQEY